MNSIGKICLTGLVSSLAVCAAAQPFDRIERRNPWNAGRNVTGIRTDSVTISYVESYGRDRRGGFRDISDASRAWSLGAVTRTITHLDKISMTGSFSFDHTSGQEMSGSMFIHPGFYPFDVLEFTPGRKDLQTYAFSGGIAADVSTRWRIGAKIDFASRNYSKRKDLRHTNYRLDMTVAPGLMYHSGAGAVGAAYVFSKNSEQVSAEEIGEKATYHAFLDKGLMYGAYEYWKGGGLHLSESGTEGFPVREIIHGVAVQGAWKGFYADVEYLYGFGSAGEKQTVWFGFPSHRVTTRLACRFGRGDRWQFLRLTFAWSRQMNDENVLGTDSSNGISIPVVYGKNRIFERDVLTVNPEYEWTGPQGEFCGGVEVASLKRLSTQMYPYTFTQSVITSRAYLSGVLRSGCFGLRVETAFAVGRLSAANRVVDPNVAAGDPPCHLTEYSDLQNEYLTAPHLTAGLSLRCDMRRGFYAEAGFVYKHGFELRYIDGADRWCRTLKIGYTF